MTVVRSDCLGMVEDALVCRLMTKYRARLPELQEAFATASLTDEGYGKYVFHLALAIQSGVDTKQELEATFDRFTREPEAELRMRSIDRAHLQGARAIQAFSSGGYTSTVETLKSILQDGLLIAQCPLLTVVALSTIGRSEKRMGHDAEALQRLGSAAALAEMHQWQALAAVIKLAIAALTATHLQDVPGAHQLIKDCLNVIPKDEDPTSHAQALTTSARIARREADFPCSISELELVDQLLKAVNPQHPFRSKVLCERAFAKRLWAKAIEERGRADGHEVLRMLSSLDTNPVLRRSRLLAPTLQLREVRKLQELAGMELADRTNESEKNDVNVVRTLRASAFSDLEEAELVCLTYENKRGIGSVELRRAYLYFDRNDLREAQARYDGARSYANDVAESTGDEFLRVRVGILQMQITLRRAQAGAGLTNEVSANDVSSARLTVERARGLGSKRLLGRALTWYGITLMAAQPARYYAEAQRCYQDAKLQLEGSLRDYTHDDLDTLGRLLRKTHPVTQPVDDVAQTIYAEVRKARRNGTPQPTNRWSDLNEACDAQKEAILRRLLEAEGYDKFNRIAVIIGLNGSLRVRWRRRLKIKTKRQQKRKTIRVPKTK